MRRLISFIASFFSKPKPIAAPLPKKAVPLIPLPERPKKPSGKIKHENTGYCFKCQEIMDKYPGLNEELRQWFEAFQKANPIFHTSCAGRGEDEQMAAFYRKASNARWGQSAHNYNCALDLFENDGDSDIYENKHFQELLKPSLPKSLKWYGEPGSAFYELPHVELRDWKGHRDEGSVILVE